MPLTDIKDAYPVQVTDYTVTDGVSNVPAFRWWVPFVLKKRERILKKVKSKYWSVSHKYGLERPESVAQALEIDWRTGTDFWRKTIEKEIQNVFPAFEFIEDNKVNVPPGTSLCRSILYLISKWTSRGRLVWWLMAT